MEYKKSIVIITLGIITFIASIIFGIIVVKITMIGEYRDTSDYLVGAGFLLLLIIAGVYVKLTNFGITNESELQKNINEKKKLKEQIKIAELRKKLKEMTE